MVWSFVYIPSFSKDSVKFTHVFIFLFLTSEDKWVHRPMQETRVWFLVGKIPSSRKWQPAPVFLPENSHGQRSLVGYRPRSCRVGHAWATECKHTCHAWPAGFPEILILCYTLTDYVLKLHLLQFTYSWLISVGCHGWILIQWSFMPLPYASHIGR